MAVRIKSTYTCNLKMLKIKTYCFFLSFVLVLPVLVATLNFILENSENMDAQAKCFSLQEEEEDSEEDTDDNREDAKHFNDYSNLSQNALASDAKLRYGNQILKQTSYKPGVIIPPPELS